MIDRTRSTALAALVLATLTMQACANPQAVDTGHQTLAEFLARNAAFPLRAAASPTGSEFLQATAHLSWAERERAILEEIEAGNVPDHIRNLIPISLAYRHHLATVYVLPDYLALGSDDDYVIMPMAPRTAMDIAARFGFMLPTRKLVDDIYRSATLRLAPQPLAPGPQMTTNAYFREHDRRIKAQLPRYSIGTKLISGHKKDIVLTPRLLAQPGKVAIYGWHRRDGQPIQPLSLFHPSSYVDYSHGVRLVSRTAILDGARVDLATILADAELSPLVSDEGLVPFKRVAAILAPQLAAGSGAGEGTATNRG